MFNAFIENPSEGGAGSLSERILATARANAERILLVDDAASFTGSDLLSRFEDFNRVLPSLVPPGGRVGILFENSAAKAFAILAAMAIGRVPVILNPSESSESLEALLPKMRLHALLIGDEIFVGLRSLAPVVRVSAEGRPLSTQVNGISLVPPLPREGAALILYTSGSMGEPKGVELSERGLLYSSDFLIRYFGLTRDTVAPVILPICHSMAMNTQFLPTFLAGGRCVFYQSAYSLNRIFRNIDESQGDFVALIGEILRLCWEERKRRNLPPNLKVKHIQLAGGIIRADHLRMARELFPNAVVHKGYGLTEGIRVSMISSLDPNFLSDNAGYVLPGQEIEVRSSSGRVLPPGALGHLWLRGPNVMLGYDGLGEHPAGLFSDDGYMRTGDMGVYTIDRRLIIQGRSDSIFKVQGKRVSAKEIEKAALDASGFVRDVKVLPLEDEKNGARPVLFLEITAEKEKLFMGNAKAEFERIFKEKIANKNSLPREVFILNHFPRTYNGKLKSGALAKVWSHKDKARDLGTSNLGFSFKVMPQATFKVL
jgi:acyl-CoA synthetase (AMP-forming)/AMP-acid ligase II